jgi:hypothetical protein
MYRHRRRSLRGETGQGVGLSDKLPKIAAGEYAGQAPGGAEGRFAVGIEDLVIVQLVLAALVTKKIFDAVVSILIHILDYAFPVALQLVRVPLFIARVLGDGMTAIVRGIVRCLPVSEARRAAWREIVARKWSWLRQKISYQAFEHAVHRMFEGGMAWVFRKCRTLSPSAALLVIAGAVLWLPISFGTATAIHAVLLAKAASLPAWMQLLHPLATFVAKSKLLVLPVYPAAWPQAKRHPLVQAIGGFYRELKRLHLIRKTGYRYRQLERATQQIAGLMGRLASIVGLRYLLDSLSAWLNGAAAWIGKLWRGAAKATAERLSGAWLVGSIVESCSARDQRTGQSSAEKPSERLRKFFAHWSIKFSAEYYEAKDRAEAATASPPV